MSPFSKSESFAKCFIHSRHTITGFNMDGLNGRREEPREGGRGELLAIFLCDCFFLNTLVPSAGTNNTASPDCPRKANLSHVFKELLTNFSHPPTWFDSNITQIIFLLSVYEIIKHVTFRGRFYFPRGIFGARSQ